MTSDETLVLLRSGNDLTLFGYEHVLTCTGEAGMNLTLIRDHNGLGRLGVLWTSGGGLNVRWFRTPLTLLSWVVKHPLMKNASDLLTALVGEVLRTSN